MPRIFDNIERDLKPALRETLRDAYRADISVGYFNLRGWEALSDIVAELPGGDGGCVRLLVGMHKTPKEELREWARLDRDGFTIDQAEASRLRH